ncbi:MAG: c-type cytochrome [Phycisphaerae bacterium]|nr:c-type cytochrome [Phycisphaerae bacterium]
MGGVERMAQSGTVGTVAWRPPTAHGLEQLGRALLTAVVIGGVIYGGGVGLVLLSRAARAEAERRLAAAHETLLASPPLPVLPVGATAHGRDLFLGTCAACHGPDGKGMPGLGKDLTTSALVASMSDVEFVELVMAGQPLGKPLPMPPKGGNDAFTEADLRDIELFVRGLQDPRRMPELPAPTLALGAPSEEEKAKALAAAGGDAELAGYIAHGSRVFAMTCSACHGKDARGIAANGKDLLVSEFAWKLSEDDLLAFLRKGRDPGDPANTTGIGMPPKGGNPALNDDDLLDVIEYLRSLRTAAGVK